MGFSLMQMETLLEQNRLVTHFQPILSLSGKRVFGVGKWGQGKWGQAEF